MNIKDFNVGIKGVIIQDNKVLLLKRLGLDGAKFWDLPGGRIDGEETIMDALKRELIEEVSLDKNFEIKNLLHAYRYQKDINNGRGLMLLCYLVESEGLKVRLSDEHSDHEWFGLNEIIDFDDSEYFLNDEYKIALIKAFESHKKF